jgi:hypothetical protein
VYKLLDALYRLKQVPQAWYARLKMFLLKHGYVMGSVDKIIFTLKYGIDFLLVQIYVYSVSSSLDLIEFFYANFAGCGINLKSTSDTCYFLDLLLYVGQLTNSILLHSPPQRPSM